MRKLYLMLTIVNRAYGEEFLSFFNAYSTSPVLTALGEGTTSREILDMWGLESTQKSVLFTVVTEDTKLKLIKELKRVMRINIPGNGIALTLPLKSITTLAAAHLVPDFNSEKQTEGKKMDEKKIQYELVIAIADKERTDEIMTAAREAGARGGTRLRAKGTAPDEIKKFFGVNISEDKEMLFIVATDEQKKPIMQAISATNTEGKSKAISFSLPIDDVEGLYRE